MRIGIIDLGTNTFNLLIAEVDSKGSYHRVYSSKVGVKLGEGSFEKKYISEEAFQRGLVALDNQIMAIKERHCDRILAFATAAMRNATNAQQFVERVRTMFGITIQIIDGEKEASMIYNGVQLAGALDARESGLIMDIGGGSTEFIIANDEEMLWKQSFDIGVTRFLEKFQPSNPITTAEIRDAEDFMRKSIKPLMEAVKENPVSYLVGSSGSFDTIADIIAHRKGNSNGLEEETTVDFDIDELNAMIEELIKSTREERTEMEGMVSMRVDMIVLACIFTRVILSDCNLKKAKVSRYALREGVLFDVLKGNL